MPNHAVLAPLDNEALVHRIRSGDQRAEHSLALKFQPHIKFIGRALGADLTLCEDLAQETMLKVIKSLRESRLREPSKLKAYVSQTTRFTYYEWQRDKNSELELRAFCDDNKHANDVEQDVVNFSNKVWIIRQIAKLKMGRDREILTRFYMNQQEKHQVCDAMDISPQMFDRQISRARQRLRKIALEEG